MTKILIVGLGGIGSWMADKLDWLVEQKQITAEIHGYDPDTVEEKNTRYQNFTVADLFENKAETLDLRFNREPRWFFGHDEKITDPSTFEGYDLVVSAVDNLKFRKLMFENCKCFWIDLRSEGRSITVVTKHPANTPEQLNKLVEGDLEEEGSCQIQADLDADRVQLGNQIVATIGAQLIINWSRGIDLPPLFIYKF